ncbi:MAG: rhodanese-related sulfurtransferase [Pseudomonadota bacterium]
MTGISTENYPVLVAALYKFASLEVFADLQAPLLRVCLENDVMGTILLASEGINGTIAGPPAGIKAVLQHMRRDPRLADLEHKESGANDMPFLRMKVRLKKEIVTLGAGDLKPAENAGTYVDPQDWNALISDPDTVIVDTRNDYEVAIGTFENATDPETTSFREFPDWVDANLADARKKKVAMFCTGGIRCEKSTALLKAKGFEDVYHLKGGILKYLEEVPEEESLWQGECFVFDNRVSVGHGLVPGPYDMCHACRRPISDEDKAQPTFEQGVSCPHCFDKQSEAQRQRYQERQHQMHLARERGEAHLAVDIAQAKEQKKRELELQRERSNTAARGNH